MNTKCLHCSGLLEKNSNICTKCGGISQTKKLNTIEKMHSNFSITSLVIGCFTASLFLWLTQVIFYGINVVVVFFAGRYVLRDIIAFSLDGFFILLGIVGLILGIIGLKRRRSRLSPWVIVLNSLVVIIGSYRLLVLVMVAFVF